MLQELSHGAGQLRHYHVPDELEPGQKFDHWRHWYGSAVETPMRLERIGRRVAPSFNPSATSLAAPGFSLIEVRNEPVAGYWDSHPDSNDLRLVYFRNAPTVTLFSPEPEPVSSGCVKFLDVSRRGGFEAPAGLHAFQVNVSRSLLDLDERSHARLLRLQNLNGHALVKSFVVPSLLNWRRPEIVREVDGAASILTSVLATLVTSLLGVPGDETMMQPTRRMAVRNYIEANFRDKDLCPDSIAAHFNMSRRSLFYLFEKEALPLGAYIRTLRTVNALHLLTDSCSVQMPFADVADASGFSGLQSMRRALKESTGLTVREVRQYESLARISIVRLNESLAH
ncbi:helix-turn-helix domain-containing protein [Arthrobacter sp.]|uniref:AraC family transcriptional regulator n=1 Tax=Arthrobacter sp. TaxID=1667 RepID=UPI003391DF10